MKLFKVVFIQTLITFCPQAVLGAPPQSCANKFVGTWEWSGGDATYDVTFHRDGRVTCGPCVDMTWSCKGNSFAYYYGSQKTAIMTLSDDGNTMTGMNLMVTNAAQMAVRKGVFKEQTEQQVPVKPHKQPGSGVNAPKVVAGPFLQKPDGCPKGSSLVEGTRTYEDGRKVPVWRCFEGQWKGK